MSSAITRRSHSASGTSPETILRARPSTIAVLPTPGSPISTGLFFVRRLSTWITRRISSSRPITGSSLFCSAISVRSRPKRSSGLCSSSGAGCCMPGAAAPSGDIVPLPLPRGTEPVAHVGGAHELAAAIWNRELGAERAAHLLQLLGELYLRVQRLQLELLDPRMHPLELRLLLEHAFHAGEVQSEVGRQLLDAAQLLDVVLRVQSRALRRALGLDQPPCLVHAQRLRVHVRKLRRH